MLSNVFQYFDNTNIRLWWERESIDRWLVVLYQKWNKFLKTNAISLVLSGFLVHALLFGVEFLDLHLLSVFWTNHYHLKFFLIYNIHATYMMSSGCKVVPCSFTFNIRQMFRNFSLKGFWWFSLKVGNTHWALEHREVPNMGNSKIGLKF